MTRVKAPAGAEAYQPPGNASGCRGYDANGSLYDSEHGWLDALARASFPRAGQVPCRRTVAIRRVRFRAPDADAEAASETTRSAASAVAATACQSLSNPDATLCTSQRRSHTLHDRCARACSLARSRAARSRAAVLRLHQFGAIAPNCFAETGCGGWAWHAAPHGWVACCSATDPGADPPPVSIIECPVGSVRPANYPLHSRHQGNEQLSLGGCGAWPESRRVLARSWSGATFPDHGRP